MRLLLDTCSIIWAVGASDLLSVKAKKVLTEQSSEILVSPMSCAEIACLVERKKIKLDRHWKLWFRYYVEVNGWTIIPVDLPVIEESYSLPGEFHRDPVDRILVATSRLYQAHIVTADEKIIEYPHVESVW
jgi:PIN domain nuclease of toxin-antitoxin system